MLRVAPSGAKSWCVRYRLASGEQRRLTLGAFPALGLETARAAALQALAAVASAQDPAGDKQKQRRAARRARVEKPQTLTQLWAVYQRAHLQQKRSSTIHYQTWLWTRHIEPRLGKEKLADIDRACVRAALREIGSTAPPTANRALALLRHMLNFAVDEEIIKASPLAHMGKLYAEQSRDRVLTDAELRAFWRALDRLGKDDAVAVSHRMGVALKLMLLTAARVGDVAGLHADEIDIAARSWTIPAARHKSKRAHTVPLSATAWDLLVAAFGCAPQDWRGYAFPHVRDENAPAERMSFTRAMQRVVATLGMARATPHDLRRTAATYIASERVGAAPHVVSAVLGHTLEGAAITAVYNRHRYDAEKRAALNGWAAALTGIVSEKPPLLVASSAAPRFAASP